MAATPTRMRGVRAQPEAEAVRPGSHLLRRDLDLLRTSLSERGFARRYSTHKYPMQSYRHLGEAERPPLCAAVEPPAHSRAPTAVVIRSLLGSVGSSRGPSARPIWR